MNSSIQNNLARDKGYLGALKILGSLGKGAFAKVKLVQDAQKRLLAAKIFRKSKTYTQEYEKMISNEVDIMQKLEHPNIIKYVDNKNNVPYFTFQKQEQTYASYILMEFAEKGNLSDYLFQAGRFELSIARTYFVKILTCLDFIFQQKICHRDVKPENILFDSNFQIKICDFGLSTFLPTKTRFLRESVGTKEFMAPEFFQKKRYNPEQTDLFSLGIILFMMVFAKAPFSQANENDVQYLWLNYSPEKYWI